MSLQSSLVDVMKFGILGGGCLKKPGVYLQFSKAAFSQSKLPEPLLIARETGRQAVNGVE